MAFLDNDATFEDGTQLGFTASPQASVDLPALSTPAAQPLAPAMGAFNVEALGFASPPEPRLQSDQEYLQSLPTMQKIGLALQAFSAGVAGRPSPINELLRQKRQRDKENRDEILNTINVISKGSEMLRKMPAGIQRDAVAKELGKAVPKYADVFEMVGSERDDELKSLTAIFADPDVQTQLVKSCSGTADFGACWRKQANDETFMKRAYATADAKKFEPVTKKLGAVIDQAKSSGILDEFKGPDGKFAIPYAKMVELNAKAKIFTDAEMDFIKRNDNVLAPFGIKSQKEMDAEAAERGKQSQKPVKEDFKEGQTRRIHDTTGRIELQQEYRDGKWVNIGKKVDKEKDDDDEKLTKAQRFKLRREKAAYDNAQKMLGEFGINPDGSASKPKVKERLAPTITNARGDSDKNPNYDPIFAGRVKAWLKITEAGDPAERDPEAVKPEAKAEPAPAQKPAASTFNLASWELTKKKHGLTDAELEKRLGKKKPTQ